MLHSYHPDGKLKRVDYVGTGKYVEYGYDAAGRRVSLLDTRLTTSTVGGQMLTWAYDKLDRVTTETYPDGSVVAWTYDALGRRTSVADPDGRVTAYAYGNQPALKRLTAISNAFGQSANYGHDAQGRVSSELFRQGAVNLSYNFWTYDAAGRVATLGTYAHAVEALVKQETYTYNAASMRTRIDYLSDALFQPYHKLYSYDALGQLVQEHKRWSGSNASAYRYAYTYDPAGNRTQMVHFNGSTTRTVVSAYNDGNQLTTHDWEQVTYDANGNLGLLGLERAYEHNSDNRLVTVWPDKGELNFVYDALGRRIGRYSENGRTHTRYYYDGLNILMTRESSAATGGAGSWLTRRAYTLKQASIGQIVAEHTATAWNAVTGRPSAWTHRFYHFDLLGNTTAETDANGMVANIIDMEAFGTVLQGGQAGFRLTTKEYDTEAGAYYFSARWYQPGLGRFAQKAPYPNHIEHDYSYGLQNPVLFIDPTGKHPLIVAMSVQRALDCGLTAYAAALFVDCLNHCKKTNDDLKANPNIPSALKKNLGFEVCLENCMPILCDFNVARSALGCMMAGPKLAGKVPETIIYPDDWPYPMGFR